MSDEEKIDWGKKASRIIKVAMVSKGVKAPELAKMLEANGHKTTNFQINNSLSKGNFKAAWFLEVLDLLGEDITNK